MYDAAQKRIIARELARAGDVAGALRRLREEFETFGTLSESTLRRLAKQKEVRAAVAAERVLLAQAQAEATVEVERERAILAAAPGLSARLAHDEKILRDLRKQIEGCLETLDAKTAVRLYADLTGIDERRRRDALPACGTTPEGEKLCAAVADVLVEELGAQRAAELTRRIRARYLA
ncbi:MAG: hypothetical protein M5U26_08355 [Planctomycetota bacterium]|nr:hypothetical protein [Planctomycetota bacterium]